MTPPPQEGETTVTTAGKTALMVPFAIQRARLENITLSIQRGSDEFTVRDLKMAIDDVGPGRTGTIDLRSEVAFERSASQSRWAGALLLTGALEESSGGQELKWNMSHTLKIREWPEHVASSDSGAITLDQTLSGRYDFTQATVHADSSLTLRQGETSLGNLSLQFTRTESPDGTIMDVGMKIQEMTDEAVNLLLGNDESFRLRSAHMSGDVNIHAIGERYDIRSIFTGQQLQAVSGKDHDSTSGCRRGTDRDIPPRLSQCNLGHTRSARCGGRSRPAGGRTETFFDDQPRHRRYGAQRSLHSECPSG